MFIALYGLQLCRRTDTLPSGFSDALVTPVSAPAPEDVAAAPSVRHARHGVAQRAVIPNTVMHTAVENNLLTLLP